MKLNFFADACYKSAFINVFDILQNTETWLKPKVNCSQTLRQAVYITMLTPGNSTLKQV